MLKSIALVGVGLVCGILVAGGIKVSCKDWMAFQSCTYDTPYKSWTFTNIGK